jgi:hypothetical protein
MKTIVRWMDTLSDNAMSLLTALLSVLSAALTTSFVVMLQAGI